MAAKTFKEFLKEKRMSAGFTLQELANLYGVKERSTPLRYESDKYPQTASILQLNLFALAIGTTLSKLIAEYEEQDERNNTD